MFGVEEQVVEQGFGSFFGWWFVWMYYLVDFDQGFQLVVGVVDFQGVGDEWIVVDVVGVQGFDVYDLGFGYFGQEVEGQFGVVFGDDFVGSWMYDCFGDGMVDQVVEWYFQLVYVSFFQLVDVVGSDMMFLFYDYFVVVIFDVDVCDFIVQVLWDQFQVQGFVFDVEDVGCVEGVEDFFGVVVECVQQY